MNKFNVLLGVVGGLYGLRFWATILRTNVVEMRLAEIINPAGYADWKARVRFAGLMSMGCLMLLAFRVWG